MTAIRHIEFWTQDISKTIPFYEDFFSILKWEKVDENSFSYQGTKIYFKEVGDVNAQQTLGPRHICFEVENKTMVDVVSTIPKIQSRILHGPGILHPSGSYMVVFKDPDGYILEVACKAKID